MPTDLIGDLKSSALLLNPNLAATLAFSLAGNVLRACLSAKARESHGSYPVLYAKVTSPENYYSTQVSLSVPLHLNHEPKSTNRGISSDGCYVRIIFLAIIVKHCYALTLFWVKQTSSFDNDCLRACSDSLPAAHIPCMEVSGGLGMQRCISAWKLHEPLSPPNIHLEPSPAVSFRFSLLSLCM